jgi:hypothetical protein
MPPRRRDLVLYGQRSDAAPLAWDVVEARLAAAGTYWVVARGPGHPHPRPVWGVWIDDRLQLSIGSPVLARALAADPVVTVHLDSGTEVVVVEGAVAGRCADGDVLARYDEKYEYAYDLAALGPLTTVAPATVLAWESAGWAGREGFTAASRWRW